jgi:hypothetical protein
MITHRAHFMLRSGHVLWVEGGAELDNLQDLDRSGPMIRFERGPRLLIINPTDVEYIFVDRIAPGVISQLSTEPFQ